MPMRRMMEMEPPGPLRYLIGAAILMVGVVLPLGYMMFRNKRVPSSPSFSKQTSLVQIRDDRARIFVKTLPGMPPETIK